MNDLTSIVKKLEKKGSSLEILDQTIDTSTAAGKAFLQMLGVFAEFETNLRRERRPAEVEAAKDKGKYLGRKPSRSEMQQADIQERSRELNPTQLSKAYSVSRATIYNILKK